MPLGVDVSAHSSMKNKYQEIISNTKHVLVSKNIATVLNLNEDSTNEVNNNLSIEDNFRIANNRKPPLLVRASTC